MAGGTAVSRAARGTADPVRAVSVVSTGSVEIHPEQPYGTSNPLYWWLLKSPRWTPPRPINAYSWAAWPTRCSSVMDSGQCWNRCCLSALLGGSGVLKSTAATSVLFEADRRPARHQLTAPALAPNFIVGDDWTVAVTVAVALVATWLLHTAAVAAWWLPPLAAVVAIGASLRRAGRATPDRVADA